MKNFNYKNPTNIVFGKDSVKNSLLNLLTEQNVKNLLIISGKGSIKRNGLYDDIQSSLKDANLNIVEFFGVEPNPTIDNVNDAINICKENDIDFILSAGGGSSLDATKAISRGVFVENIWDVFKGKESGSGEHIKFASIMTIPATGSEANAGSVVSNNHTKEKLAAMFTHPIFSILDPTYTFTLPAWQTGAGASDIVSHIFEQYFSLDQSEITHQIMFGILRTLATHVPLVLLENDNYDARAEIMYAGYLGLNRQLSNGQGISTWDVHGIEHPLSGHFNITHGAGLAVLTPKYLEVISQNERAHALILKLGQYVFNTSDIDSTINAIKDLFVSFGMPTKLSELDNVNFEELESCANDVIDSRNGSFGVLHTWTNENILKLYKDVF